MTNKQTRLVSILFLVGISILSLNFLSISKQDQPAPKQSGYESFAKDFTLVEKTYQEKRECSQKCSDKLWNCKSSCQVKYQNPNGADAMNCTAECQQKKNDCEVDCR